MDKERIAIERLKKLAQFLNRKGKTNEVTERLQEELKSDLWGIIIPPDHHRELAWTSSDYIPTKRDAKIFSESRHARFSSRRTALELLLDKLSRLNLETRYTTKDSSLAGHVSESGEFRVPVRRLKTELTFPDGQKITIEKVLNSKSEREGYFAIILDAIDSGVFARLRLCEECQKYFVAAHQSKIYCGNKCQRRHDKIGARSRAKAWRIKQD